MGFKVYDVEGNDVTDERQWFMDTEGNLYYLTDDIDSPLMEEKECWIGD